jgi:hypothetical protein
MTKQNKNKKQQKTTKNKHIRENTVLKSQGKSGILENMSNSNNTNSTSKNTNMW